MSGKIPWLVSLIGSLATAELLLSQRPASHGAWCENISVLNLTTTKSTNITTKTTNLTTKNYKSIQTVAIIAIE